MPDQRLHRRIPTVLEWTPQTYPRRYNTMDEILGLSEVPDVRGNCYGLGDAMFPAYRAQVTEAKRICAGCPITDECLRLGLDELDGVWGGLTAAERRVLPRPLVA